MALASLDLRCGRGAFSCSGLSRTTRRRPQQLRSTAARMRRATAVHDPSQTWLPRDASVPRNSILVGGASLARWQPLNYHCAFTRAIAKPTSIGGLVMDRRGFIRSVAVAGPPPAPPPPPPPPFAPA